MEIDVACRSICLHDGYFGFYTFNSRETLQGDAASDGNAIAFTSREVSFMLRCLVAAFMLPAFLLFAAPTVRAEEEPELTFGQALAIAMRQVPDGTLIRARVEGAGVFGFCFWVRPKVVEVEIAKNGTLKKRVKSGGDEEVSKDVLDMMEKMTRGKTKLPDGRILEIAGKNLKNTPLKDLKYEIKDGRLIAQVGGLAIDAQTGNIVK